jgi:oligogalacturonide lyase
VKYADPATELDVTRITDPAFASGMAPVHLRQFGRRSDFLIYWSERLGSRQVCSVDLKSGESKQLTDVPALDVSTISLGPDERTVAFFNGSALSEVSSGSLTVRELYQVPSGFERAGFTHSADGSIYFAQRQGTGKSQIMRAMRPKTAVFLDVDGDLDMLQVRPRRAQLLYRAGGAVWLLNTDGSNLKKQLKLEPGETGEILWTPSGRTLVYLHIPNDPKQLITLREHTPDDGTDRELARTSQFEAFASNGDSSVFCGASRSKASAYVLLLLRVTRRELTLCEHKASDPSMVSPMFSPDSQNLHFVSDRHGKTALYRIRVDKFVETTLEGGGLFN